MTKNQAGKKVMIVPGYQCNNSCVFCINSEKRGFAARSTLEVKKEMAAAAGRGCDYLEFAGGENAIRPDFPELVASARKLGFKKIAVATNGRMFSYPDYARSVFDSGLTMLIFSVHSHKAALHDSLTRVDGSFKQLLRGIENAKKYFKGIVATNTAVTRKNFRFLPETGEFISGFGFYNSEFIYADPSYGGVNKDFRRLMPRLSEFAPYMRECLDLAKAWPDAGPRVLGRNWSARYVPLCYFAEYYPRQISEAREALLFSNVQHVAPDYISMDAIKGRKELSREKPSKCLKCALYSKCEGIWKEYLRIYGDSELKPVLKA